MYGDSKSLDAHVPASYPVPFKRLNLDYKTRKTMKGFMNDGNCTNPSDPNSMFDNGPSMNAVCNANVVGLGNGKLIKSKVPKDHKKNELGAPKMNMTFYNFGSRTNIRQSV